VISASLIATMGVAPAFLVGALAVMLRRELGFSESQLGAAIAVFFAAAALTSVPIARIVERIGGRAALAAAAAVAATSLTWLALVPSWGQLAGALALGGVGNALSQLAGNLRLAGAISPNRLGLAFGIRQSSVPAATLLGGAAVPMIALTIGWRWAFALAAITALLLGTVQARGTHRSPGPVAEMPRRRPRLARLPLVVLAGAGACGSTAATGMAAFVVEYVVDAGYSLAAGGLVLAVASVAAIAARVGMGWVGDRLAGGSLKVVIIMLATGALAVAAVPVARTLPMVTLTIVLAYALGWGWPGLFNFTIVRRNPQAPAAATGITQIGMYTGGVCGPLLFGVLVQTQGHPTAWTTAAALLAVSAVLTICGRHLARRAWMPLPTGAFQPKGDT
jgi:predicted MFS family arabinose efflux permease